MKVIYNNKMISESSLLCAADHRGLSYGDGLFETIICKSGTIFYLDRHLNRLSKGMKSLGMLAGENLDPNLLENHIMSLINANGLNGKVARIKIIVWRKSGGLFTPENNYIDCMINVKEQIPGILQMVEAAISEQVKLFPSSYSRFKTCNMLPYIIAGLEKQQRNIPELVLLNCFGHIAECSSSNIFWVNGDAFFTPSLETGCIEGIMRSVIIDTLKQQGIIIKEVEAEPEVLSSAGLIFTSNVSGIKIITSFQDKVYNTQKIHPSLSALTQLNMF